MPKRASESESTGRATPGRRGNGDGSIVQRPNGTWRGRVMVGHLANGKPDRRSVTGRTRLDVKRKIDALIAQKDSGRLTPKDKERDTVGTFLTRWLDGIAGRVKGSTVYRYRSLVNANIIPSLGKLRLSAVKPDLVAAFYVERQTAGLSPTTVQLIHTTLRKAFGDAVEYGYIADNPVARVKPPRRASFEPRVLSTDEVQRLLRTAEESNDRLTCLWTLLAHSGARIGELLTLSWESVSFERKSIAIVRSLSIDENKHAIIDTPKTARGRRVITLDDQAMDALKRHKARQNADKLKLGPDYTDLGLVFASAVGTAMSERNVIREFKEALQRAGFSAEDCKRTRIHDLRHYHITEAVQAGMNVKSVSARAGHASVAFTLDRYAHATEVGDRAVAEAVSRRLRAASGDAQ